MCAMQAVGFEHKGPLLNLLELQWSWKVNLQSWKVGFQLWEQLCQVEIQLCKVSLQMSLPSFFQLFSTLQSWEGPTLQSWGVNFAKLGKVESQLYKVATKLKKLKANFAKLNVNFAKLGKVESQLWKVANKLKTR